MTILYRSVGCTVVEMLTGKPPLGDLEPAAAMFRVGSEPTKPTLPKGVSQAAKNFIEAALTWLVLNKMNKIAGYLVQECI